MHIIYRGYYMPVRGYEFYIEISSRTREEKIHIHKRVCNNLFRLL